MGRPVRFIANGGGCASLRNRRKTRQIGFTAAGTLRCCTTVICLGPGPGAALGPTRPNTNSRTDTDTNTNLPSESGNHNSASRFYPFFSSPPPASLSPERLLSRPRAPPTKPPSQVAARDRVRRSSLDVFLRPSN
jgi:hypothetical protein